MEDLRDSALPQGTAQAMAHMEALMEALPAMEEKQRCCQAQIRAGRIAQLLESCSGLGADLKAIQARSAASYGGEELYGILLREKRELLAKEQARLARELENSPFASPQEALLARMPLEQRNALIRELNAFRADYAYTLRRCMGG